MPMRNTILVMPTRNGEGVEQDYVEAVKWYRLAAEQGNAVRKTILVMPTPTAKVLSKITLKRSSGIA